MAKRKEPKGAMEIAYTQLLQSEEVLFGTQTLIEFEEETNMKAIEMTTVNGEVAVVTVNGDGIVQVQRAGQVPQQLKHTTFEAVVSQFEANGWTVKNDKQAAIAASQKIPVAVQEQVDAYLKLHAEIKELEKVLDQHKKYVREYMENNKITSLKGTEGRQVYLQDATASNSSAVYMNYPLGPVMAALNNNNEILRQVTEIRVNSDKLEALMKVGSLPNETVEELKGLKIVKPGTPRFAVKK